MQDLGMEVRSKATASEDEEGDGVDGEVEVDKKEATLQVDEHADKASSDEMTAVHRRRAWLWGVEDRYCKSWILSLGQHLTDMTLTTRHLQRQILRLELLVLSLLACTFRRLALSLVSISACFTSVLSAIIANLIIQVQLS